MRLNISNIQESAMLIMWKQRKLCFTTREIMVPRVLAKTVKLYPGGGGVSQ